jgi:uncharacterized protein
MPRPCKLRNVACDPEALSFKPCGIPRRNLEAVLMTLDELEALRLADLEGLYQEDAAKQMNVSRQTFGNIISSAHRKVADFLINSKSLTIEGGSVTMNKRSFTCCQCRHRWMVPFGVGKPDECPECKGTDIHRSEEQSESGRRSGCDHGAVNTACKRRMQ